MEKFHEFNESTRQFGARRLSLEVEFEESVLAPSAPAAPSREDAGAAAPRLRIHGIHATSIK